MTNHPAAEAVADEVRAQMAKQNKRISELATVLGVTPHTAGTRVNGTVGFSVVELLQVSAWLGVPVRTLLGAADSSEQVPA